MSAHCWVDATAGAAGDMLLGALIDAGADLDRVVNAVGAVLPQPVELRVERVSRAGLSGLLVHVDTDPEAHPRRAWQDLRRLIDQAELDDAVRGNVLRVFTRLAQAEARVHGVDPDDVHFHEVGAWDSVADVVGVCAALAELEVDSLSCSVVELGSGGVASAHGRLPVPVPAVLRLVEGFTATGRLVGECTTPTGAALLTGLSTSQGGLPSMLVRTSGVGAGSRDPDDRPNVVRVVLGETAPQPVAGTLVVLETNVDDLDPRVWPGVLDALLAAGAADAWLTPILMKKGRPAHTLHVLAPLDLNAALRDLLFRLTPTLGVREHPVSRTALDRRWVTIYVSTRPVRVKVVVVASRIVTATPEFEDVRTVARETGCPEREVLAAALVAAAAAGYLPGAAEPDYSAWSDK